MKKFLACLIIFAFLSFVIGGLAVKAKASAIGYIDVQRIFKEYKEIANAEVELKKEEEAFKKEYEERKKKLDEAQQAGKTKEELDQLQKDFEEELKPLKDKLDTLNKRLTEELQGKIVKAVEKVAKKLGIDLVMDKQAIITGGTDLTTLTLTELNK